MGDDPLVEILASQMSISSCRQNLENAIVDSEEGYVESSSSQVVNNDLAFITSLVQSVRNRGRSGLIDYTENIEASDDTSAVVKFGVSISALG